MAAWLEVVGATKRYVRDGLPALHDATFSLEQGEILALLGPSGSGKSTALRLIAGFEHLDAGSIALNGVALADASKHAPPESRGIGLVFQDYALFPHLSVRDNIAFGLAKRPAAERMSRVEHVLHLTGLKALADRAPHELSGGEQQRVSVARALAPNPRLVLLDEPFSNLDAELRRTMRSEVRRLWKQEGVSGILVTHDRDEAFAFADRVVVLREGRVLQIGTPEELYARPGTAFVAGFLGEANLFTAEVRGVVGLASWGEVPVRGAPDGPCTLLLRPEQVVVAGSGVAGPEGMVVTREFQGRSCRVVVRLDDGSCWTATASSDTPCTEGARVRLTVNAPATPV